MTTEFKNSIRRLSFLYCLPDIKIAWINPCVSTMHSKASQNNFSNFLTFLTDCQHSIINSNALLPNILINFNHSLYNLKHVTFLIIPLHKVSKSFLFCSTSIFYKSVRKKSIYVSYAAFSYH